MRKGTVDLVFANEAELHSLYQTSDFEGALKQLRADTKLGVVTRSEKGCVVAAKDGVDGGAGVPDSKSSSTPPAPATCSPPASCSASCATPAMRRRPARRAGGGRSDPAHRRTAAGVAEGTGGAERVAGVGRTGLSSSSWPGLTRPSTSFLVCVDSRAWMPGTSPGMTESCVAGLAHVHAVFAAFSPSFASTASRIRNFWIFPVTVIGNSSTNST